MGPDIATSVRFHRKRSGLTQAGLAELAGVGKSAVFDIEHGKLTVQWITVLKVLAVLNIIIELKSPGEDK